MKIGDKIRVRLYSGPIEGTVQYISPKGRLFLLVSETRKGKTVIRTTVAVFPKDYYERIE